MRFATKKNVARTSLEVGFILLLFYGNLLMGEFTHSGLGSKNGLIWALGDIFTAANFAIGITVAFVAHVIFDFLRARF